MEVFLDKSFTVKVFPGQKFSPMKSFRPGTFSAIEVFGAEVLPNKFSQEVLPKNFSPQKSFSRNKVSPQEVSSKKFSRQNFSLNKFSPRNFSSQ